MAQKSQTCTTALMTDFLLGHSFVIEAISLQHGAHAVSLAFVFMYHSATASAMFCLPFSSLLVEVPSLDSRSENLHFPVS